VLMALINNWDLKDMNTAIYQEGNNRVFLIGDLGASFGAAGRSRAADSKGNPMAYSQSQFVRSVHDDTVDFKAPARPSWFYLVNPKEYLSRVRMEWIGKGVPREDVRWMAQWLARLSPRQIRDAFRAGGYSPEETEQFAQALERRIAALTDL